MSVYLRHSLFWDVWDCYGKLMSEPQKSSMDWCSYIYIYSIFHHVSPCFFHGRASEWHVCSCFNCFLQLPEVEPALVMSSSQVAWKRNTHWRSDGKIWRMTRLSKKTGWMTDDGWWRMNDGWWWMMMDDGWWWMYPSMMVFVCLHFRQSSLHKVPLLGPEAQVLRWNLAIATAAKAAKWKRAMSLMLGLNAQALQPDTWITWCWEFTSGKPPKLREYSRKVSLLLFSAAMYHHLDI